MSDAEFWSLTPHETYQRIRTLSQHERDRLTVLAWQTANLSRAKKLPKLESLIGKREIKQQTPEEMRAALLGFNRRGGNAQRPEPSRQGDGSLQSGTEYQTGPVASRQSQRSDRP